MSQPPPQPAPGISRRAALARLAAAGGCAVCARPLLAAAPAADPDLTFFVVSDPQVHLEKWGTAGTEATIRTLNALPGRDFPLGGTVAEPRAVLVTGDLVDAVADPRHWEAYQRLFDPNGKALLKYRVFECIGNHDLAPESATDFSVVQREFIARNQRRQGPEVFRYDAHHYHYSWDWGPLHLVNLNLFPGNQHRPVYDREAPWNNPRRSLDFLRDDLRATVADSGRPVILFWHYGLRGWGLEKWWLPEDLTALKQTIEPYNVVLILHGHEHAFAQYTWEGYPVFMCPSPQRDRDPDTPTVASTPKGFLVVRLRGRELQLAHHTDKAWAETWRQEISLGT
jgi:3',5'-cyclic AMP phosphodiesterase CpdA